MYKKILVPVDGSAISKMALSTALTLAKTYAAEVVLFHAVHAPIPQEYEFVHAYFNNLSQEDMMVQGHKIFDSALAGLDVGNLNIIKKCIVAYPPAAILEEIKEGVDLVIMGSRGHGPITGALIGSVTQRVLAEASCPVLVVR